jgi:hypothetical protein
MSIPRVSAASSYTYQVLLLRSVGNKESVVGDVPPWHNTVSIFETGQHRQHDDHKSGHVAMTHDNMIAIINGRWS